MVPRQQMGRKREGHKKALMFPKGLS